LDILVKLCPVLPKRVFHRVSSNLGQDVIGDAETKEARHGSKYREDTCTEARENTELVNLSFLKFFVCERK
jgi:hypothetical protein